MGEWAMATQTTDKEVHRGKEDLAATQETFPDQIYSRLVVMAYYVSLYSGDVVQGYIYMLF